MRLCFCVRCFLAIFGLLLSLPSLAFAEESGLMQVLVVSDSAERLPLEGSAQYLRDTSRKLTFEEVAGGARQNEWQPLLQGKTNFDWTSDAFWVRTNLRNSTNSELRRYLVFDFARIDLVDAYVGKGNSFRHLRTGLLVPFREWPEDHNQLSFPIGVKAGEEETIYLRLQNSSTMHIAAALLSPSEFHKQQLQSKLIAVGFLVSDLILILFGFAILFAFRETLYLFFVAQIIAFSLTALSAENFDYQYIFPWGSAFASGTKTFWGALGGATMAEMIRRFLAINRSDTWRFAAVVSVLCIQVPLLVFSLWTREPLMDKLAAIDGTITFPLLLTVVLSVAGQNRQAGLFAAGFVLYLILMGIYVPVKSGLIAIPIDVQVFPFLAVGTQLIFICFAILQRVVDLNRSLSSRNAELAEVNHLLEAEIRLREQLAEELEVQRRSIEETERLRVMGEMSRNIAHEINTPLSIVSFKLQNLRDLVEKRWKGDSEVAALCTVSLTIIERAASIVRTMRLLARDGKRDIVSDISLDATLSQLHLICNERASAAQIRMIITRPEFDIIFKARESAVFQMLTNLVNNAIDALKTSDSSDRWLEIAVEKRAEFLAFTISDNGRGVPPQLSDKIFEPFFTTKPGSTGMGMGLSLARSVAMEHGGNLVLESLSNPTRFLCTIPVRPLAATL